MNNEYDIIIVGGGIGGLMAAYELKTNNKELRIAIIEKGKELFLWASMLFRISLANSISMICFSIEFIFFQKSDNS